MRVGQREAGVQTTLTVKECAEMFQQAVGAAQGLGSKLGGLAARVKGNDNSGFYTPSDDSPFAGLNDDKPTFTVGAFIPKMNAGALGNGTNIHMYVWDRGTHRDVEFFSPHRMGGGLHSQKLVRKCLEFFQSASSNASVAAPQPPAAPRPTLPVPSVNVPAGWHRDPHNNFDLRYWDGSRWTEHVSTQGQQSIDRR